MLQLIALVVHGWSGHPGGQQTVVCYSTPGVTSLVEHSHVTDKQRRLVVHDRYGHSDNSLGNFCCMVMMSPVSYNLGMRYEKVGGATQGVAAWFVYRCWPFACERVDWIDPAPDH